MQSRQASQIFNHGARRLMMAARVKMYEASVATAALRVWHAALQSTQGEVDEQKTRDCVHNILIPAMDALNDTFYPQCKHFVRRVWTEKLESQEDSAPAENEAVDRLAKKVMACAEDQCEQIDQPTGHDIRRAVYSNYRQKTLEFAIAEAEKSTVNSPEEIGTILQEILNRAVEFYLELIEHYWEDLTFCGCDPHHLDKIDLIWFEADKEILFHPDSVRMRIYSFRSDGLRQEVQQVLNTLHGEKGLG